MRRAGEISSKAFRDVLRATRPGVIEGQLESVFEHSVKMQGAQWMAYPPVVAGGERANCLHYIANNRALKYAVIHCLIIMGRFLQFISSWTSLKFSTQGIFDGNTLSSLMQLYINN